MRYISLLSSSVHISTSSQCPQLKENGTIVKWLEDGKMWRPGRNGYACLLAFCSHIILACLTAYNVLISFAPCCLLYTCKHALLLQLYKLWLNLLLLQNNQNNPLVNRYKEDDISLNLRVFLDLRVHHVLWVLYSTPTSEEVRDSKENLRLTEELLWMNEKRKGTE